MKTKHKYITYVIAMREYNFVGKIAGVVKRASGAVRGGGRRDGAAGALPRPAVRADARVLGAPRRRAPLLPAAGGRPGALRAALLPPPLLLPLSPGAGDIRATEDQFGLVLLSYLSLIILSTRTYTFVIRAWCG